MSRYITARGRTKRAWNAYTDLLDTAEYLREEMSRQLATFDITMTQFRVLETLWHDGPQYQRFLCHKFLRSKQDMVFVIKTLKQRGWVRRVPSKLTVSEKRRRGAIEWDEAKAGRPFSFRAGVGRRVIDVRLTRAGKRMIEFVFPKHVKVVKSQFRVLEGREQATLSRLCRKLREGDIVRFFKEIVMKRDDCSW